MGDAVLEIVAHDDHVAHRHAAGQKQRPHIADQAGLLHHQIGGNQAAAKVHGDDEEQAQEFPPGQVLLGHGVCGDVEHDHRENGADGGVQHGVQETGDNGFLRENRLVAIQGEAAGQQEGLARVNIIGIGEGGDDHIVKRIRHHEQHRRGNGHQNDVAGLVR